MNGDYAEFDYSEEKIQRVEAELKQLARAKPHRGERGRKLAGSDTSKRPKRDRRAHSTSRGQMGRPVDEPALRRLTNLDEIAAKPEAEIVVCGSEDAAHTAARVFPEWIATASSGGAAKTDWRPLAGRRVLIWPANESRACRQAREAAGVLAKLYCEEILLLDAAALAARDPAGGQREPVEEYDAADALADWRDAAKLRKIVEDLAEPFVPGPAFVSVPPYTMNARGLWKEVERGRGDDKSPDDVWVSAPFEVLGLCRDPRGAGWGKYLRWRDGDGREHMRLVGDARLHGEPGEICSSLADEGLRIDRGRQRDFVGYLSAVRVERCLRSVKRTGWHEIDGGSAFSLPGETIGPRGAERVILETAAHGPYEKRATVQEWRDGVGKLAAGHVMPVLAISAALAGPLLYLAGMEGGGLHFCGPSSIGKTTLLQMAASVWGSGAAAGGYVRTWNSTANGLEGVAASATDTALVLDELGQVDPSAAAAVLYSLANGGGKQRAGRDGAAREQRTWRAMALSNGELSIEAKLAEDRGRKSRGGQLVRMLDISAARAFGVFDSNGPGGDAAALAKACKAAATTAYGTAGPEFVRLIIVNGVTGDAVRSRVKAFVGEAKLPIGADGQVVRAAERLGLIAAAGELATRFGLTPWREGEATAAAIYALKQWIDTRGGAEPAEVRQAIRQVRLMIENHGESRFQDLDNLDLDARPVNDRLGWRKGSGAEREWRIPPETWKEHFCKGLDPQYVARALAERGMLRRQGGNELQCKVNVGPGPRVRAYVLTSQILAGEDHDER
jgi:putative DNA primase/helicase